MIAPNFGLNGYREITSGGGNEAGEVYFALQALEESVVSATAFQGDSPSSLTIPAGVVIYGQFETVTAASGKVLAYIGDMKGHIRN